MERPSWDEYFVEISRLVARRSTCLRRQVGAVIVKEKNILSTGYNGTPAGITHCSETGCLRDQLRVPSGERHELCRGLHAEQNAIIQAAKHGVSISGGILYCTNFPCVICSKMIINAGLSAIVFVEGYPDTLSRELLEESGISIRSFHSSKATSQDSP